MEQQVFYTIKEASEILRVSDETVRRMINNGQLEAIRVQGTLGGRGQWRVRKESLDKYTGQQKGGE
jgi:excisionase family DNA binding protein